jgi:hypothetical protein
MKVEIQHRKLAVNSARTHQPKQLDLFEPARPARRNISGRVRFFAKPDKEPESNEPIPFNDDAEF